MKKFTTLLTMAFIALMSISLTSCDEDSDIAYTLDGTWKGNMLVEYGNHNALYSVIRFDQNDGFYSGTGYWIDYFQGKAMILINRTVTPKDAMADLIIRESIGEVLGQIQVREKK